MLLIAVFFCCGLVCCCWHSGPEQERPGSMSAAAAGGYGDVDPEAVRKKETYKNIKDGFALFDRDGKGVCDVREIGTIVRHLGICPTEIELRDMITEIEEEEPTGFITYARFERMMARILLENQCVCHFLARARIDCHTHARASKLTDAARRCLLSDPRDSEEKLLRAFRVSFATNLVTARCSSLWHPPALSSHSRTHAPLRRMHRLWTPTIRAMSRRRRFALSSRRTASASLRRRSTTSSTLR